MKLFSRNGGHRYLLYLFFALIFFFLLAGVPRMHQRVYLPEEIGENLTRYIHLQEKLLNERSQEIFSILEKNPQEYGACCADITSLPEETGFLVYYNDTLRCWSESSVPFEEGFPQVDTGTISLLQLANGWYLIRSYRAGNLGMVAFTLIKREYPIQNQYLHNGFPLNAGIPSGVGFSSEPLAITIHSSNGLFLAGVSIPEWTGIPLPSGRVLIFLGLTCLFFFLFLDAWFFRPGYRFTDGRWRVGLIAGIVLFLRVGMVLFHWPQFVYHTELFTPQNGMACWFYPSTGDFVLNGLLMLAISLVVFFRWPACAHDPPEKQVGAKVSGIIRFVIVLLLLAGIMSGVYSMVASGLFPVNLHYVSRFSFSSIPAVFGLGFWLLAWVFLALRLSRSVFSFPSFSRYFLALLLVSLCTTVVLYKAYPIGESHYRESLALQLVHRENPETENQLAQIVRQMHRDTLLHAMLIQSATSANPGMEEEAASAYLLETYFGEGWSNFTIQVTICTKWKELRIQPQGYLMDCDAFFQHIISAYSESKEPASVVFLDYGYGNEDYLLQIADPQQIWTVFIELSSLAVYKGSGYPELLVDRSTGDFPDISEYSFAFYEKGQLVHRVGPFPYGHDLTALIDTVSLTFLPAENRMDHRIFTVKPDAFLLISISRPSLLNTISTFSYLLIFLLLLSSAGYVVCHLRNIFSFSLHSLRNRLQIAMLGLILISFVVLGLFMVVNLVNVNSQKNQENLLDRTLSILIEAEHKFDHLENLNQVNRKELESVLVKFSNVFFSDINLYEPSGILFASSRPQIFDEGLISRRINPEALTRLRQERTGMFVLTESIGKQTYLSAYIPFYNTHDQLLGYLNLPYFSKQDDLKREISSFLVTFINIYVLFMLLGVLLTYLLSDYITAPLKLLASRLGNIRLGKSGDALSWKHQDEIGQLVREYNRMVDELAVSAEKLAMSERESAWREMAQQVAHEIKNPLTPMKLSVQHLLHTWQDNPADWTNRLNRFADALIAQIDTLSRIASGFSYFARMPEPENQPLDLDELVQTALTMYPNVSSIHVKRETTAEKKWIYADRNQVLRVFSNVVNNAMQALENQPDGVVQVKVTAEGSAFQVSITDNGKGISPLEAAQIFQPKFTTKSSGTGLGLAIVRGILQSMGGSISFDSEPGTKTTFYIRIPAYFPNSQ